MHTLYSLLGEGAYQKLLFEIKKCITEVDLSIIQNKYYGNNGIINQTQQFQALNQTKRARIKDSLNQLLNQQRQTINNNEDLSYEIATTLAKPHILQRYIRYIKTFLQSKGFQYIEGPLLVNEFDNFDSLGTQKNHPSRNEEQTFYLDSEYLLRTQTSAIQKYALQNNINNCFTIGPVFRRDQDATHTPMFHQLEIMSVNEHSNLNNLFDFLQQFLSELLETQTVRFRPSYFPFTTPSYEVDIKHNNQWLEVLGCGMVAPVVFQNAGRETKTVGWAMGAGIERLTMLKFNLKDIRSFYQ